MLRTIQLSRAKPAAENLWLVTKRYQQSSSSSGSANSASTKSTPGSSTSQSSTSNPSSANRTQTASTNPSSNAPIDRTNNPLKTSTTPPPSTVTPPPSVKTTPPPPPSSRPSGGSAGSSSGTVKAVAYGVALGLGVTLLYAEYDNDSFRRKVESTLPLSSTILSGLDKVIDPVFGRHKKLTTIISEKLPDLSAVTSKLPDKDQLKKAGEQVKDAANAVYSKLPDQKQIQKAGEQVKDAANAVYSKLPDQKQIQKAGEQAKDAINDAYDKLPEYKKVKGAVTHAADQVKDAAKTVRDTVKDALPATKGLSGEQSRRGNDPVFLEEAGEVATPPPIKRK